MLDIDVENVLLFKSPNLPEQRKNTGENLSLVFDGERAESWLPRRQEKTRVDTWLHRRVDVPGRLIELAK